MIPVWVFNCLWSFVVAIGIGSFYYFASISSIRGIIWTTYGTLVVIGLAIALHVQNDFFEREQKHPAAVVPERFHVDIGTALIFQYGSHTFLYLYNTSRGPRLASPGLAFVLELANKLESATMVTSYAVEIHVDGQWVLLPSISPLEPKQIYIAPYGNLKSARHYELMPGTFDTLVRDHNLLPGETLRGWVYLEWPSSLRDRFHTFDKYRITIKTSDGESRTYELPYSRSEEDENGPQISELRPDPKTVDLSNIKLESFMDSRDH